jgi:predicted GNAT family N-acyltransferase
MTTVQVLDWDSALPLARPVRFDVFVREQGVPVELEWDEFDVTSEHAVATDASGEVVGTARLVPVSANECRIGRMAVLAAHRGQGVGAAMLEALLQRARERGERQVVLHAQMHAAGFYRRFGFEPHGPQFDEAGIPHVEMRLGL